MPFMGFAEGTEDRNTRFTGTVQYKFDMVPKHDDATYRASLVASHKKRTTKRPVQVNYDDDGVIEPTTFKNDTIKKSMIDENRRVADKRERLEEDIVRDRIFNRFRVAQYLTFKELNEFCQQPDQWLKECLNKVAIYHTSGKEKNYWSLKPDFKTFESQSIGLDPNKFAPTGGFGKVKEQDDDADEPDNDRMDMDDAGDGGDGGDYDMAD